MYRIRHQLNENNKKVLYHSIIESRLMYALPIWGRGNKTRLKNLQKKQNKILRIIYNKKNDENIDNLYKKYNYKNIAQLLIINLSKTAWNIQQEGGKRGIINIKNKIRKTNILTRKQSTKRIDEPRWENLIGKRKISRILARIINEIEKDSKIVFTQKDTKSNIKKVVTNYWMGKNDHQLNTFLWEL